MYLSEQKPKRHDSISRVLILVLLIIVSLYIIREQIEGAIWTRPFDLTPTPTPSAERYFEDAEMLYTEGMLDDAITAYRKAYDLDQEDNVALFRLTRLMVFHGQSDLVLQEYGTRLQDETLGDARTMAMLGMALNWHALFNEEDMLPIYVALNVIDEDQVQTEDWIYEPESMTRRLQQQAQKVCDRAVRMDPDLPEAYAYLAEALTDRQRYDEAKAAAETAISLNPNIPDTHRAMAYVYEAQGEYEKAIGYYEAAIHTQPALDFLYLAVGKNYRAIGYQYQLYGEWDKAEPMFNQAVGAFEEAIKLDPKNPNSYDEIGWTYGHYMGEDREFKERAVDYLEEAIIYDPDYSMAYRHLGQVYYYGMRNYEEAIPNLEKAIELGDIPAVDTAMCHIMLGWSNYTLDYHNPDKGEQVACDNATSHFESALDLLLKLPQRELALEELALQGIQTCK